MLYTLLSHPKVCATPEVYARTLAKEDRVNKAFAELSEALKDLRADPFCFLGSQDCHERRRAHVSVAMNVHNHILTLALMHPKADLKLLAAHSPYQHDEIERAHRRIQDCIQAGRPLTQHHFPGRP